MKVKNTIIVVEGKNDYSRIKQIYPNSNIMITNGSEVSEALLNDLRVLQETNDIIIFTDPDYPGERIRKIVSSVCPNAKHAFIQKKFAISKNKKKVGIEHVELSLVKEALDELYSPVESNNEIDINTLYDLGLIGDEKSKLLREKLCEKLNIGYVNGKQLVKRLNLFGISIDKIKEVLDDIGL